jgi:hypothetical protein
MVWIKIDRCVHHIILIKLLRSCTFPKTAYKNKFYFKYGNINKEKIKNWECMLFKIEFFERVDSTHTSASKRRKRYSSVYESQTGCFSNFF